MLETVAAQPNARNLDALKRGLRGARLYRGRSNLRFDYRAAEGHVRALSRAGPGTGEAGGADLIVTRGTPAARAAKEATSTVPIVMAAIGEPLNVGVVASLARPGGNVTGLSAYVTELAAKRIELLKGAFPQLAHGSVSCRTWATRSRRRNGRRPAEAAARRWVFACQQIDVRQRSRYPPSAFAMLPAQRGRRPVGRNRCPHPGLSSS